MRKLENLSIEQLEKELEKIQKAKEKKIKEKMKTIPEKEIKSLQKELRRFIDLETYLTTVDVKIPYDVCVLCSDGELYAEFNQHDCFFDNEFMFKQHPKIKKQVKQLQKEYNIFISKVDKLGKKHDVDGLDLWDLIDPHGVWH